MNASERKQIPVVQGPRFRPAVGFPIGLACILLGLIIQGMLGGGLIAGGIVYVLVAIGDVIRFGWSSSHNQKGPCQDSRTAPPSNAGGRDEND